MRQDEIAHTGVNHFAPPPSAENAVVARTQGLEVLAVFGGNAGAQIVGRLGLPRTRNVVQFTFDGEQSGVADVLRTDQFQLALFVFHFPGAAHQFEVLKHGLDGFQVVVGIHVQHRVVLVVELAMRLGTGVVAFDQVQKVVVMRVQVAIGVHGDKPRVLQKARIDPTPRTGEVGRHSVNHIVFKPLVALVGGQVVDRCG